MIQDYRIIFCLLFHYLRQFVNSTKRVNRGLYLSVVMRDSLAVSCCNYFHSVTEFLLVCKFVINDS